jgi:thymidylate synthase (FAD)
MKIEKSKVEILEQEPGIIGMYRFIERAGRVAYKTEDKITEDSWQKFLKMLKERGHWAVFNQGTVYLRFNPAKEMEAWKKLKETKPWTKWTKDADWVNVTTNYRVILQQDLGDFMEKYWTEPDASFYRRIGSLWSCSRATSHQLVRHRLFCYLQASQRYCNYSKDKFGGELTFILPQWIYRVRDDIGNTIDPVTYEPRNWILHLDGDHLWDELTLWDRTVSSRDDMWKAIEKEYMAEMLAGDGEKLLPEEARGILPNDIKTELIMTGYKEDWFYEPPKDSPEKAGFFFLRCAHDAQADIRVLAQDLKEQMIEKEIDKWK